MNYNEYLMHLNRQFDESKVKRDKSGRFATKSSSGRLVTGPVDDAGVIDISEYIKATKEKKTQTGSKRTVKKSTNNRLVTGPVDYNGKIDISENIKSTKRKTQPEPSRFAQVPDEKTKKLINKKLNKTEKAILDESYKQTSVKYRKKIGRILSRLIKREISLRSAVTVINHATKERVNAFMNSKFRNGKKDYFT